MLSQYLMAERMDPTEPASFYVPGLEDWRDLKTRRGRAALDARSLEQKELVYPVLDPEDVIEE